MYTDMFFQVILQSERFIMTYLTIFFLDHYYEMAHGPSFLLFHSICFIQRGISTYIVFTHLIRGSNLRKIGFDNLFVPMQAK